jgi:hypothetical protein
MARKPASSNRSSIDVRTSASSSITNTVGDSIKGCQDLKLTPGIGCTASLTGVVPTRQPAPRGSASTAQFPTRATRYAYGECRIASGDIVVQQVGLDSISSVVAVPYVTLHASTRGSARRNTDEHDSFGIDLPQPYQQSRSGDSLSSQMCVQENLCRECDDVVAII